MRISDWSSDVCSSDLRVHATDRRTGRQRLRPATPGRKAGCSKNADCSTVRCQRLAVGSVLLHQPRKKLMTPRIMATAAVFSFVFFASTSALAAELAPLDKVQSRTADALGLETGDFTVSRSEEHTSELQSLMRISY